MFWQQISIFNLRVLEEERFVIHVCLLQKRKILQSNEVAIKGSRQAGLLRFMKMMSRFMNSTD